MVGSVVEFPRVLARAGADLRAPSMQGRLGGRALGAEASRGSVRFHHLSSSLGPRPLGACLSLKGWDRLPWSPSGALIESYTQSPKASCDCLHSLIRSSAGKAITSSMEGASARSMTNLSTPRAIPAAWGIPILRASKKEASTG